ncbi:hypothetical protein QZH41_003940 [Actinostola sp. cb2023]|nr:hypothetical protein QZH41_003940 [Actinostola sp. cb2023]
MNNSTTNITVDCLGDSDVFKIVSVVLYAVIFVVSLFGNILVIFVVYRNKSLRNSTNYFIVNMSVSDLFIPILVIPRVIKEIARGSMAWDISGLTGEILCKTVFFLSDATPLVSILSLVCISCDRFCAVMFPLRNKTYIPRSVLIALTWIISFGVLAPYFYTFRLTDNDGEIYCYLSWSPAFDQVKTHKAYATFTIVTFIIIPFFMLSFIYLVISILLINQKVIGDLRSEKGRAMRNRKTRTVVKLAFTIVLASALCFGPYGVLLLLLAFKFQFEVPEDCTWRLCWSVAQFLAYSNAAVNPTIYFIYVQNYKKELKRILSYMSRPFSGNTGATRLVAAGAEQLEMKEL